MQKSAREILSELNRLERKTTEILIHGVGEVKNVTYDGRYWRFTLKLNDRISISTAMQKDDENLLYFQEGDIIEFFGGVHTYYRFLCDVSDIFLYDVKLSEEERAFSEIFMWNIGISQRGCAGNVAFTMSERGLVHSEIKIEKSESELESKEDRWAYGHLVKEDKYVILQLDKIF